jgi:6 kDa early secretory antigenic target
MSDLRVAPEALHASAAQLRTESARIEGALRSLEGEVSRLRGDWDGAAQVAYDQAQSQWSVTLEAMKVALRRISDATDGIADDYVDSDRASAKRFQ